MPPHLASAPNISHLWAALLVEELVRQGTTFFVVCPGSRSTPLAVAVGQNPRAEALVHWDERAAAFVALGWGRATGKPAAVVTTSGTAVANLLPAAVEADADGIPLLLLTADRPPELRETGANQTIRQPPIFQDVARWTLDWPVPTPDVSPRWVLSTAAHAAHRAASGPVHLNLPFREPLGAQPDGVDAGAYLREVERWSTGGRPAVVSQRVEPGRDGASEVAPDLVERIANAERGLVVVGDLQGDPTAERAAASVAGGLGWPLVPDLRSGNRLGARGAAVPFADLALTSRTLRGTSPDVVIHLGGRVLSKRVTRYLVDSRPQTYLHVRGGAARIDPDSLVTDRLEISVPESATILAQIGRETSGDWRRRWEVASRAAERVAQGLEGWSEPALTRLLAERIPGAGPFVVAASMPIRDLDSYGRGEARRVFSNRGASGIDGTIAMAHGVARGTGAPTFALVGDLALLHDLTSLSLLHEGPAVRVVVVNNDGGGIFHRLPIAGGPGALAGGVFERFFGTPHGLTFGAAAQQFDIPYRRPETPAAFAKAVEESALSGASALIEVRTDREEQAALRRRIEAPAADAVDATLA